MAMQTRQKPIATIAKAVEATKPTTITHTPPVDNVAQTIEAEVMPATITEAPLPCLEILADATIVAGNGGLIQYKAGQRVVDRWFVSHALANGVKHRVIDATEKPPTRITALETRYLILNNGRGSTTIRHGQTLTDPSVVAAAIAAGIHYSDNSRDA
jgi:hypothetical protein